MPMKPSRTGRRSWAVLLPLLALSACGGEDRPYAGPPASCSVADQKAWLADYMNEWYFWYRISPQPDPAPYASVDAYFGALLYTGTDASFPADRWSFSQSTESFNRFFGDGEAMGYGVSVAGLEVEGQPGAPLYVRHVEALSPAAANGVVRGDEVRSINGRSAAEIIAADDYSDLTAANLGDRLTLVLRNTGGDRTVVVDAAVYALTPVTNATVVTTPLGRKMGYVVVKDMLSQANAPLETAFSQFKAAGVDEIVLDLRYNGGGLVSVGNQVASYVAGTRGGGRTYASLLYNDKRAAQNNQRYTFSASEQVINGLRGIGIDVVSIGDTTCGKPVGFLPADACGTTYNAVNFESVNEDNEGRYFDGFDASCPVAEDFTQALGSGAEPLLAAARGYADAGTCPAAARLPLAARDARQRPLARSAEPDGPRGMIAR
jgi:carboxyl-terminal processing protease